MNQSDRCVLCQMLMLILGIMFPLSGCASYSGQEGETEFRAGGITSREQADLADWTIDANFSNQPAASFPASIAVARVRDNNSSYGSTGRFELVTVRQAESDDTFERIGSLPMVRGVAPLSRLLTSPFGSDEHDLRVAASMMQSDMLLMYTIDTRSTLETTIPVIGFVTLGIFPNDVVRVTTTASAVLIDTRTGYIYGVAEATDDQSQIANAWTNQDAKAQSTRRAEREALKLLTTQIETMWSGIAHAFKSNEVDPSTDM